MLIGIEPNAVRVPLPGENASHGVLDAIAKASEPPPRFETVIARFAAGDCCTKEKLSDVGLTFKLGCPGAVVVSTTGIVRAGGRAAGAVMVIVP